VVSGIRNRPRMHRAPSRNRYSGKWAPRSHRSRTPPVGTALLHGEYGTSAQSCCPSTPLLLPLVRVTRGVNAIVANETVLRPIGVLEDQDDREIERVLAVAARNDPELLAGLGLHQQIALVVLIALFVPGRNRVRQLSGSGLGSDMRLSISGSGRRRGNLCPQAASGPSIGTGERQAAGGRAAQWICRMEFTPAASPFPARSLRRPQSVERRSPKSPCSPVGGSPCEARSPARRLSTPSTA